MLTTRQLFLSALAQTSETPLMLEIESAEGIFLYGKNKNRYYDLISGISVSNVGHRHPKVVEAIKAQVDQYMHLMVYGEYVITPQVTLADKLRSTLPSTLNSIYFVNSGAEATEGAMKLAKRYTGRAEIISCKNAYHGSTQGALSVMGDEYFKQSFRPLLPGIRHIEFNNTEDLSLITTDTAAVIVETIQGEAGVRMPSQVYMKALRAQCSKTGALLILDEIQTGFGRTGKFWAYEHFGIEPDILLTSKGMGGGMPIGAFIAPQSIMKVLANDPVLGHITTFGGHPVCCASSLATINVILEENLMKDVAEKEKLFHQLLVHPAIKEVRSKGLLIAVEFESYEVLKPIIDKAIAKGVITDWFLFCNNSMRIAPPLIITEEQIREVCGIILECIG
ncbi:MAG TPA: aspartate aminotransferase family protein [Cytophagaceae bacterium]|nr:aspartate aminotransferase family protein [Cytophagaceae bacterium]